MYVLRPELAPFYDRAFVYLQSMNGGYRVIGAGIRDRLADERYQASFVLDIDRPVF